MESRRRHRLRREHHIQKEELVIEIKKSPINRAVQLVKTRITLYRPKFPIFSSAFVLAIIFIIAPYVDKTYHKISEEGRVASDSGDVGFDLGKFSVQVSQELR